MPDDAVLATSLIWAAVMKAWRRVWGPIGLFYPGTAGGTPDDSGSAVAVEALTVGSGEE